MQGRNAAGLGWPGTVAVTLLSFAAELECASAAVVDTRDPSVHELAAHELAQQGQAQFSQRDFADAQSSFSAAIRRIEQGSGPTSPALIEPLASLADALIATQQIEAAVEPLQRAVLIIRRSAGLYDERQYALLLQLADLHSLLGDLDAASDSLRYMRRLSESAHGHRSLEYARSLAEIGGWQCRIGEFTEGRGHYRQSVMLLDERASPESLLDALLGLARCCLHELSAEGIATTPGTFGQYRGVILRSAHMDPNSPAFRRHISEFLSSEGERALRRAAQLVQRMPFDDEQRIAVLMETGDWFQLKDHRRTARRYYAKVQELASRLPAGPDRPLSLPVRLLYPTPPLALRNRNVPDSGTVEHFVELELTVRADGRIDSERVIERDLSRSALDETLSALHAARFRPRFVNGAAVDTEGVRLRQEFKREVSGD